MEAVNVHLQAGLGGHLLGQVDREAVGVVQGESNVARDGALAALLGAVGPVVEHLGAGFQGLQEGLLLGQSHGANALVVLGDFWVGGRHGLPHGVHELLQGLPRCAQQAGGADDAAQQAAQNVAASLVAGGHAVQHQHQTGAGVVGDHAEAHVVGLVCAVLGAGDLLGHVNDGAQQVGLVHVVHVLQDAGDTLDAQAGIDVLLRQLADDLEVALAQALTALVLHEHEVPDLDVAGVVDDRTTLLAVLRAAVVVDLRAGSTRAGNAHGPVVVLHTEALDLVLGYADLLVPDLRRLIVVGKDGDPQALRIQAQAAFFHRVGQQRPSVRDRAFLEVRTKGEVARHLEERVVAGGDADLVDVQGAHALLDGGRRAVFKRWVLLAQEVGLERNHAGVHEQKVRVVQDQRCAGYLGVPGLGEVLDEALADLMRLHGGFTS